VEHRSSYAAAVDHVVEYAYDYANRWVYKRLDDDGDGHAEQRRIFIYDGNQIVMDFWRTNSGDMQVGHLRQRYLWGPAVDQILAEEAVDGGTPDLVQWTLTDHLNTVREIAKYDPGSDMTTVVNHLIYDAFGRVMSESNPATGDIFHSDNWPLLVCNSLFLFTGRPFDSDTQLHNNLNRWYDAGVGRWLSEDPIGFVGGDGNLYRYVRNTAAMYPDSEGLQVPPPALAVEFPTPIILGTGSFSVELAVLDVPPKDLAHVGLGQHRVGFRVQYNRPKGVCEAAPGPEPRTCSASVVLTEAIRTRGLFGTAPHFDSAKDPANEGYAFPEYTGQRPFGPGSLADAPHSSEIVTPQIHDVTICAVCRADLCDTKTGLRVHAEYVLGCVHFEFHEGPPPQLILEGRKIIGAGNTEIPVSPPDWLFWSAYRGYQKSLR